jgi:Tfp pilus assembly protein PilF
MMRIAMRMGAALTGFLAAGFLHAGAQCRLLGSVTDSAGAPVDGVSIVITTPKLGTFKQNIKTDSKGKYSTILNDCTMPYHVVFEKDGFVSSSEDKKIPINDMGTIDVKLMKVSEVKAAPGAASAAAPAASGSEQAVLAFNAGVEAVNAGDKTAAEAKFQEAVKKNPDLPAGWAALSTLAYEKKDWAKAVEYGGKAVDLDPTLTNLFPMLAEASKAMGDKKAAADWSARYAEANPDSPEILYNKGIQAYNKGKMKEAEESLAKAVDAKPDFANAQFYLGMAAFNLNHKAAAKEHLQKYLELEPNGKEAGTAKEILPTLK